MFRAIFSHHQEVDCIGAASDIVTHSQWPSGSLVETERVLSQPVHRTATY